MKPRSDTVPSWPFALACIVLLVAVACRQMNFITPKNTPASHVVAGGVQPFPKVSVNTVAHANWSKPVWGEPVEQLQLAMSLDSTTGKLIAWVRNANTNETFIHNCGFGEHTWTAPEILIGIRWVRLKIRSDSFWGSVERGVGPSNQDIMKLGSGENLSRHRIYGSRGAPSWVLERSLAAHFASSLQQSQVDIEQPAFSVWLRHFEWPKSIAATNRVTLRLVQGVSIPVGVRPYTAEEVAQEDQLWGSILGRHYLGVSPRHKATGSHVIRLASAPVNIEPGHRQLVALRAWLFEPLAHRIIGPHFSRPSP